MKNNALHVNGRIHSNESILPVPCGGSPLLKQGEPDFSPAKRRWDRTGALAPGFFSFKTENLATPR